MPAAPYSREILGRQARPGQVDGRGEQDRLGVGGQLGGETVQDLLVAVGVVGGQVDGLDHHAVTVPEQLVDGDAGVLFHIGGDDLVTVATPSALNPAVN